MARKIPPARSEFVTDGAASSEMFVERLKATVNRIPVGDTFADYAASRDAIVRSGVHTILELMKDGDAFDLIDLLRFSEIVVPRMGGAEPGAEVNVAVIEMASVVLLARGSRTDDSRKRQNRVAQQAQRNVREIAMEFLSVGNFHLLNAATANGDELAHTTAEYQMAVLNIRNRQYPDIHDSVNRALFDEDLSENSLTAGLHFSYSDFEAVRSAIDQEYLHKLYGAMGAKNLILGQGAIAPEASFEDVIAHPGRRASFTARDIASRSGVTLGAVESILTLFSVEFAETDPVAAALAFLEGDNPFHDAALVHDGAGNYVQLNVPIGTDHFRQTVEAALKRTPEWVKYNSRRKDVSEALAIRHLERVLQTKAAHVELHYLAAKKGVDVSALHSAAQRPTSLGDYAESDGLFVIGDVAICVEVKGTSFSIASKRGNAKAIRQDLEKTIGSATAQAHRLENLITANGGLWLADRTWLDLTAIREVRSVAVFLDDLGPLGTGLDAMVRTGILKGDKFPWIVSLHDLAVVAETLDRPSEFLHYLRRRTNPATSKRFSSVDELDLFMLFLKGGLYSIPDPNVVHALHPESGPPPTEAMRRKYANQTETMRVDTHTDPLDLWMETRTGDAPSAKPRLAANSEILRIVDYLGRSKRPGWFRFSADLLELASDDQESISKAMTRAAATTRRDGLHHSLMRGFPSEDGFPAFFAHTVGKNETVESAENELTLNMSLKSHQIGSDRSVGILLDQSGAIVASAYRNSLPSPDPALDELVRSLRLVPPQRMAASIPPSAHRTTRRLRR